VSRNTVRPSEFCLCLRRDFWGWGVGFGGPADCFGGVTARGRFWWVYRFLGDWVEVWCVLVWC